jgi:hypothetical protein
MPIARLVLCWPLLSVIAISQTTSSQAPPLDHSSQSSSSADPGLQSADINQATQNPLGAASKNPAIENKKQPASFDVGSTGTAGQDQVVGEVRLMSGYSELNGDPTLSFHTPGANNLAEVNYFEDHRFLLTQRLQVLSSFRATDDASIDPEHDSLQKAYIRLYGSRDEVIAGDTLVSYSRLSFNQNIKGLSTTFKVGKNWKISDAAGVFIDRWGSLYKSYAALPGRPYTAFVAGARAERKLFKDSFLGFNFSSSKDMVDTLPLAEPGSTPEPASNRLGSIDSKLTFGRLRLDTEFAYAFTDFDLRNGSGCPSGCDSRTPEPLLGTQGDWGGRIEGSYRYKRLNFRESYVRYQPNFASINARQISDLQDFSFRTSYDLTDFLQVDGTVRRSNNDLRGQLPFQTTFWGPEAHFFFHDLSFYKRGTLEIGYRHRNVQASDNSIANFVRMPYAEIGIPVGTASFTFGYEREQAVDSKDGSQSNNNNRLYTGVRGVFDFGGWHLNPNLRFELNRQAHRPFINDAIPDFMLLYDSNRLSTVGIFIEPPKYLVLELAYRDSSATIFGPTGYSRPSYKASMTYKVRNDENTRFIFAFERNSNFFFTSPNFDERIWSGSAIYRFGKRGQ